MTTDELESLLPSLRQKFTDQFTVSISGNLYDERDVQRFRTEDAYAVCFLRHQKGNVEKAVAMVDTSLKWRKDIGLNDLNEQYFPRWLHDKGGIFYHNVNKDGQRILHFQVKKVQKDSEKLLIGKKFVAWWIEKHVGKNPGDKIVALFDMSDAGFANMDMELIKYQISCFTTYFPSSLAYLLVYEMPWVLNTLWKVIKTILSADQQKAVIFVKKAEISKYVNMDQLPLHMGGTDPYQYMYLPSEDSGIEISNGDIGDLTPPKDTSPTTTVRKRVTFAEKDQTMYTPSQDTAEANTADKPDEETTPSSSSKPKKPRSLKIPKKSKERQEEVFVGPLGTITPGDQLKFTVTDESKETPEVLVISGTTDKTLAFKIKTTTPESYRVRPSTGTISPNDSVEAQVFLQPGKPVMRDRMFGLETVDPPDRWSLMTDLQYLCTRGGHTNVIRDKFLIMVVDISGEDSASSLRQNELWKTLPKDPTKYMEHRLSCTRSVAVSPTGTTHPSLLPAMPGDQLSALQSQYPYSQFPQYMGVYPPFPQPVFSHPTDPGSFGDTPKPKLGMNLILENQERMSQRLSRMFTFQLTVFILVLLLLVGVLAFRLGSQSVPVNKDDESCTPFYWKGGS